jgi:hypothetical protein
MRSRSFASRWSRRLGRLGLLLLLLPLLGGCGVGKAKVSGHVLYNGKPLPGGSVFFRPADPKQNSVSADLDEQGQYEAVLPVGEVQVSVDNRELEPRDAGASGIPANLPPEVRKKLASAKPSAEAPAAKNNDAPAKSRGKYIRIPTKYYDVETSGLQFKVGSGDQQHDIELKDGP